MVSHSPTIVLVEDDTSLSLAMERVLRAAGFHTRAFPSGESLLGQANVPSAACYVLDVHLPGMTGFELRDALAHSGNRPVIFITAYDEPAARAEATARLAAFMVKPFSGRVLLQAVKQALALT